jgi:hypothetical protein
VFGVRAGLFGEISAQPAFGPLEGGAELRNISYQRKNYKATRRGVEPIA